MSKIKILFTRMSQNYHIAYGYSHLVGSKLTNFTWILWWCTTVCALRTVSQTGRPCSPHRK